MTIAQVLDYLDTTGANQCYYRVGPVTARRDGSYTIRLRYGTTALGRISGKPVELHTIMCHLFG